jgi:hypothetical protein
VKFEKRRKDFLQITLGDKSLSCGMPLDRIRRLNSRMDSLCPPPSAEKIEPQNIAVARENMPRRRIRSTSTMLTGSGGLGCLIAGLKWSPVATSAHRRSSVDILNNL